jgi:methionyl-tRNA formyltransferase
MQMDAGLDTGAILQVEATPIAGDDTSVTLLPRLAALGGDLAVRGLADAAAGRLQARPQPEAGVTYAAKIAKAEAANDWRLPAEVIERRLRAFDPFPGARSALAGETIICWRGAVRPLPAGAAAPGEIVAAADGAITVACGQGALALLELQRPGGRRMTAAEFLRGRPPAPGAKFELPPTPVASGGAGGV